MPTMPGQLLFSRLSVRSPQPLSSPSAHVYKYPHLRFLSSSGKKRRRPSSNQWMARHLKDPYVRKAQKDGVVSRSYYKLEEMDNKLDLFRKNMAVVDIGAAPGGWSVYASRKIGSSGKLVAVDLLPLDPSSTMELITNLNSSKSNNNNNSKDENLLILQGDFTKLQRTIQNFLPDDGRANVVLSDMASNFTGDSSTDAIRTMGLVEVALDFSSRVLINGGTFIGKYFSCGDEIELRDTARQYFAKVKTVKPPASRKESSERYLVGTGFKGNSSKSP